MYINNIIIRNIRTAILTFLSFTIIACGKEFIQPHDGHDLPQEEIVIQLAKKVEYSSELLFNLSSFGIKDPSSSSQGMDIYNNTYLFQAGFSGESMYIHILDIENHTVMGTIKFFSPDGKTSHMNNINCGAKLHESDIFPLIYLSQTGNSRFCYVLRIANDASSYEIVQTIRYQGSKYHKNGSPYDWCIDLSNNLIYTYGYFNGNKLDREMVKFPLPEIKKSEVIFGDKDALGDYVIHDISIFQGSKIIDGILYAPVGYGDMSYPGRLLTIDLNEKSLICDGILNCGEPESLGIYKDGVIICKGGGYPSYYFVKP